MRRIVQALVVVAMALVVVCQASAQPQASAGKRVALVIGNKRYQHVQPLGNSGNDALAMSQTLQLLGFSLVGGGPQFDLDQAGLQRLVIEFGRAAQGADAALFYYAGHGVQVRGNNYLVPITANPQREADVDFEMLNADLVLRQMEAAGTRFNMMILDACRNNPFAGRGLRSATSGLAPMQAPAGTIIAYATQPGAVALDGNDGNSPYTRALVTALQQPGLKAWEVFNQVGLTVKQATNGNQVPWQSNSPIDGDFYFFGGPTNAAVPAARPAPQLSEPDWVPANARLSAQWEEGTPILEAPDKNAKRVGDIPAGDSLPKGSGVDGYAKLVRKLNRGEWFEIEAPNGLRGFVEGRRASEVWPSDGRATAGPVRSSREWTDVLKSDLTEVEDVGTHYLVRFEQYCYATHCPEFRVYALTPMPRRRNVFTTGNVPQMKSPEGKKFGAFVRTKLTIAVPRSVIEGSDLTLYVCVHEPGKIGCGGGAPRIVYMTP